MGQLGASNTNTNTNTNTALGSQAGGATGIRYNSQEFPKLLKADVFPAERAKATARYKEDLKTVNKLSFRKNWDPELRASVYLNEFIVKNPRWLSELVDLLKRPYTLLQNQKDEQLRLVMGRSDEREPRFVEIIDQNDAEGTLKYLLGMLMIDSSVAPATYQLIRVGRRIGEVVVMCLKDYFHEARPSQACPTIVPMFDPPITPAFPAGHALSARLIVELVAKAGRPVVQEQMLYKLADRIAENRIIAGLHYPLDNEAGVDAAKWVCKRLTREEDVDRKCSLLLALIEEAKEESTHEQDDRKHTEIPKPPPYAGEKS
jgi:hypothetical protein